jgi:predicted NBD/HSP70 family sugar kinase
MREQSVLDLLRTEGPMSRAAIARRCAVSKPTASSIVESLLRARLVVERGRDTRANGRPGRLVAFNGAAGMVVGIDVGGTTTRAVLADLEGRVMGSLREPTLRGSADALVAQLRGIVDRLASQADANGPIVNVAIGTPGVVDQARRRVAIAPNVPALEADGFLDRLDAALGARSRCSTTSTPPRCGELGTAPARRDDLVYVSIGTGSGSVSPIGGALHHGRRRPRRRARSVAVPTRIAHHARRRALRRRPPSPSLTRRGKRRPEDAFLEAEQGRDPGYEPWSTEFLDDLVWALTPWYAARPERIVLGGGIGLRCADRLDEIRAAVARSAGFDVDIVISRLGDDAGLRGAVAIRPRTGLDGAALAEGGPLARSM